MEMLVLLIQIFAAIISCLTALLSILLFLRLRWPAPVPFLMKIFTSALSPVFVLLGLLCLAAGLTTGSLFIIIISTYVIFVYLLHIFLVTAPPASTDSFEQAFGQDWKKRLAPGQKKNFLTHKMALKLPAVPKPRFDQNIPFATVPDTQRELLCDVWHPPENISSSGLAFIYLFGSAWYLLDKDNGTRPFFRHLTAQGHVVMDVAYRLAPETDMMGMTADAKRAIAWMKDHADQYKVDPARIVIAGGSAGGHLALLTAYTAGNPQFTPADLATKDLSVCAVISEYGPTDLAACYYHTNQHRSTQSLPGQPKKKAPTEIPAWIKKKMGADFHRLGMDKGFENAGALAPILGGHPDECPENYSFFSPVSHVHAGCPPTLLIQGEQDIITPVLATRLMHASLKEEKVPTVLHVLPQTDHAFDLILPGISPSSHNALFDVERFLALMVLQQ